MRDYKDEYKKFQSSPTQKKRRARRNASRNRLAKQGLVTKGDGMDVHHPDGTSSNKVVVIRKEKNRGMSGDGGRKIGVKKKKRGRKNK